MAPANRPAKDKRLVLLLSFATDLQSQVAAACSQPGAAAAASLLASVQKHLVNFPEPKLLVKTASSHYEEIDRHATALWNTCTRLRRNYADHPRDVPSLLIMARAFAFLLLDCALEIGKGTAANVVRVMKIGLKAAKNCIEDKQLANATKALERVGGYEEKLKRLDAVTSVDDGEVHKRLVAEYLILRTALSWKHERLDLAEFMFDKAMSSKDLFDPHTAESLADTLYEMGQDFAAKKQYQLAIKWLDRSHDVLAAQEPDKLSINAGELRVSIVESLMRANLNLKTSAAIERVRELLAGLEADIGQKLIVLLMKLELIASVTEEGFDSLSYSDILRQMTCSMALSEANFKLMMHHIRKLNEHSSNLACKVLDEFARARVLPEEREAWTEKVIVTRIWLTRKQDENSPATTASLHDFLDLVAANLKKPVAPAVTLAAHTIIWQRIETNYAQSQFSETEKWCRLALHDIFANSGELNMARISRKMLLCALATQNTNSARDIYGSMPETTKNDPMTRFLMYKSSIRCNEFEFAAQCLEIVGRASVDDPTLLYACVLDAQMVGNKSQALAALQIVLEKHDYSSPSALHVPSLLRLTIKLLCSVIDAPRAGEEPRDIDTSTEKLCKLFESAVSAIKGTPLTPQTETIWTVLELDWFSKNSYNLAIRHISTWKPRILLRMLLCCIAFIDQYPDGVASQVAEDLSLRKMFCEFSAATALVALARAEDEIAVVAQDYLELRKHVDSYDALLQAKMSQLESDKAMAQDLVQKLAVLLGFDFEAACYLKAWDTIGEVIIKAELCRDIRVYEIMADCLLCANPGAEILVNNMKKIVNQAWELESLDTTKLAKYQRCIFQIALGSMPDVAASLLDQILGFAEEAAMTESPYPKDEMEWVVTRSFNYAVDLFCIHRDDEAQAWTEKSMALSHFCDDGGELTRLLETRWAGVRLGSKLEE